MAAKRRRMTVFKINEISGVDRPAQVGARATIMKRAEDPAVPVAKRAVLTTAMDGHTHLIQTYESHSGETTYADGHSHPWILSEAGTFTVGEAGGHTHGIDELTTTKAAKPDAPENTMPTPKDDKTTSAEAFQAQIAELTAKAERSELVSTLNDTQKSHFAKLDAEGQTAFLALDSEGRTALIAKSIVEDAVTYTAEDGTEYRKSDDPRLAKMAKAADDEKKKRLKGEKKAKEADLEKRAGELEHIPGDLEVRKSLLKAIELLPEAEQAGALDALKAQDLALGAAFTRGGTAHGASEEASPLDAIAKRLKTEDPTLTPEAAMAKALSTPEGEAAYAKSIGLGS